MIYKRLWQAHVTLEKPNDTFDITEFHAEHFKVNRFLFSFLGVAAIDRELDDYRVRSLLSIGLFGAEQSFMN